MATGAPTLRRVQFLFINNSIIFVELDDPIVRYPRSESVRITQLFRACGIRRAPHKGFHKVQLHLGFQGSARPQHGGPRSPPCRTRRQSVIPGTAPHNEGRYANKQYSIGEAPFVHSGFTQARARPICRTSRRKSGAKTSTVRHISYSRDRIRAPIRSASESSRTTTRWPPGVLGAGSPVTTSSR